MQPLTQCIRLPVIVTVILTAALAAALPAHSTSLPARIALPFVAFNPVGVRQVKNINPIANDSVISYKARIGSTLFFFANTLGAAEATEVRGLWKSDGTTAGTVLVKALPLPVAASYNPTVVGNTLFFTIHITIPYAGLSREELWKSDGTTAGTVLVKEMRVLSNLIALGDMLFFTTGSELWKSDGTEVGTVLVSDIKSPNDNNSSSNISNLVVVGNTLFFNGNDGLRGSELWKSDGTKAGTTLVKDINPRWMEGSNPERMIEMGGRLFFFAEESVNGYALWESDGTAAGTLPIRSTPSRTWARILTIGNTLFFIASVSYSDGEQSLWRSDGTLAGTIPLKTSRMAMSEMVGIGETCFFVVNDGVYGQELWKSDGTEAGTVLVKDINPGVEGAKPVNLTAVGSTLFFVATDNMHGQELWKSDGTEAGTVLVKDINPGVGSGTIGSLSDSMIAVGNTLFFEANDGVGRTLWKSDGTAAGTMQVRRIAYGENGIEMATGHSPMIRAGSTLFFQANDGVNGDGLWVSDGTTSGTVLLKQIPKLEEFYRMEAMNNTLFVIGGVSSGAQLWKSNGTASGTVLIKNIPAPPDGIYIPRYLTRVGNRIFFVNYNGLWISDGTTEGTMLFQEHLHPKYLTVVGETLFLVNNNELWRSDGTAQGTAFITNMYPPGGNNYPVLLVPGEHILFFISYVGLSGEPLTSNRGLLWMSDGTPAGTIPVDMIPTPDAMKTAVNRLFFAELISSRYNTWQLWTSDGTAAGTAAIRRFSSMPLQNAAALDTTLFFAANNATSGQNESGTELWKSDGTEAGTVLVKDINPGPGSSNPSRLTVVQGMLFFTADDGVNGAELWQSDGTEAGTIRLTDINPGVGSSNPSNITLIPAGLCFKADDGRTGRELWCIDRFADWQRQ